MKLVVGWRCLLGAVAAAALLLLFAGRRGPADPAILPSLDGESTFNASQGHFHSLILSLAGTEGKGGGLEGRVCSMPSASCTRRTECQGTTATGSATTSATTSSTSKWTTR